MPILTIIPLTEAAAEACKKTYKETVGTVKQRLELAALRMSCKLDGDKLVLRFHNAYAMHPRTHFLKLASDAMSAEDIPTTDYRAEVVYNE
jgi:hypothetical protein